MAQTHGQRAGTVTRIEIIDAVADAFAGSSATKQQLITAAIGPPDRRLNRDPIQF